MHHNQLKQKQKLFTFAVVKNHVLTKLSTSKNRIMLSDEQNQIYVSTLYATEHIYCIVFSLTTYKIAKVA